MTMTTSSTSTVPSPDLDRIPELGPGVTVHEPISEHAPWVLRRGESRYYRVGKDLADLACAIDGVRSVRELARDLGGRWDPNSVHGAVADLTGAGLVADPTVDRTPSRRKARKKAGRIRFVPPMTVQFSLLDPSRLLRPGIASMGERAIRVVLALAAAISVGGLIAMTATFAAVYKTLSQPLTPTTYILVTVAVLATTAVHEFGHGLVLAHHGGRPTRMGVMLFYLTPAFFCDVSDGWRLAQPRQRVQVALAGIAVQWTVAGAAGLGSVVVGNGGLRDGLITFATLTYLAGIMNLVPLVKLDGYIALMSYLDVPNLRAKSIEDARNWTAHILFGSRRAEPSERSWSVLYGFACIAFPFYLVATALTVWSDSIMRLGWAGAALIISLFVFGGYVVGKSAVRFVRDAARNGASITRIVAAVVLAAVVAAVSLTMIRVPSTVAGGFRTDDNGTVHFVAARSVDLSAVERGDVVQLRRGGIVFHREVGTARIADPDVTSTTAPLSTLIPVTMSTPTPVDSMTLDDSTATVDSGIASIDTGTLSLGDWIASTYIKVLLHP